MNTPVESDLKILVVDDLASARKILVKLLKQIGFQSIDQAENGQEAFKKIVSGSYGLIISDWEMPQMKGLDLLKALRADQRFFELPFIMISSLNKKETVIEAAQAGVSDYICKPFGPDTLKTKIQGVLNSSLSQDT